MLKYDENLFSSVLQVYEFEVNFPFSNTVCNSYKISIK